jgi:hypothetical protein
MKKLMATGAIALWLAVPAGAQTQPGAAPPQQPTAIPASPTQRGTIDLGAGVGAATFLFEGETGGTAFVGMPRVGYFLTDLFELSAAGPIFTDFQADPIGAAIGRVLFHLPTGTPFVPFIGVQGGGLFVGSSGGGGSDSGSNGGSPGTCPIPNADPCPVATGGSAATAAFGDADGSADILGLFGGEAGLRFFVMPQVSVDAEIDYLGFTEKLDLGFLFGTLGVSYHLR